MHLRSFRRLVAQSSILVAFGAIGSTADAGFLPVGPTDIVNGGGVSTSGGGGGGLVPGTGNATHYEAYSPGSPGTNAIGDVIANSERLIIAVQITADGLNQPGLTGAGQAINDVIFAVDTSGPYTLSWTITHDSLGSIFAANSIIRLDQSNNIVTAPGEGSMTLNLVTGTYYVIGAVANAQVAGKGFQSGAGYAYRGVLMKLEAAAVPEPAGLLLLGAGACVAVGSRRGQRRILA